MQEQYKEELKQLELLWKSLCHKMNNTDVVEEHPPTALMEASAEVAAGIMNEQGVDPDDIDSNFFTMMVYYGEAMFHFGQHAMQNGMYRANLTPCQCTMDSRVTDDQINAFLDGVSFTNETPEQPNA